jgi:hypothetical protein
MPRRSEHTEHTISKYGVTGEDIHIWMDEPGKIYGSSHASDRHDRDQIIPHEFVMKYGEELARDIIQDHLYLHQLEKQIESIEKEDPPEQSFDSQEALEQSIPPILEELERKTNRFISLSLQVGYLVIVFSLGLIGLGVLWIIGNLIWLAIS